MEGIIRRLKIQSLQAQIEVTWLHCESLAVLVEAEMASAKKAELAFRWDQAKREHSDLQTELAFMENEEAGGRATTWL